MLEDVLVFCVCLCVFACLAMCECAPARHRGKCEIRTNKMSDDEDLPPPNAGDLGLQSDDDGSVAAPSVAGSNAPPE